jgi:hypothetical protein
MIETKKNRIDTGAAVLWCSAFLLAALVIMKAGELPGNPAYADMGVAAGGFTILTVDSGRGKDADPQELCYVLDSRDEVLLVYEIENVQRRQILLRTGANLPVWFNNARR